MFNKPIKEEYDVYLAGAMKGFAESNFPAFNHYAKMLRDMGLTVWNPAEYESKDMNYAECMKMDLDAVVNKCKGIVLLPGEAWKNSVGASAEVNVAHVCGKIVQQIVLDSEGRIIFEKIITKDVKPYLI